jgi:septum site-determining protein MinC
MPVPEGRSEPPYHTQTNGVKGDPVQAKLAALLDNVTVEMTEPDAAPPLSSPVDAPTSAHLVEMADPQAMSTAVLPEVAQITAQIKSIQAAAERSALEGPKATPSMPPPPPGAINIKGRGDGIAIEIGKGTWPELLEQLRERLTQAASFFRGGSVALDVGARPLLENELDQIRGMLEEHGMTLGVVRTLAARTFEAALALGIAAKLETNDGVVDAEIETAQSNWQHDRHFVYRGNLRAGQILERQEHILVIGDVNPGAEIVSHGDIMVWGRMRGLAHAGAGGDQQAMVLALHLEPVQLRIAGLIAVAEGQPARAHSRGAWKSASKRAEVAYINGDHIVIEPWDESKPGGLSAYRK